MVEYNGDRSMEDLKDFMTSNYQVGEQEEVPTAPSQWEIIQDKYLADLIPLFEMLYDKKKIAVGLIFGAGFFLGCLLVCGYEGAPSQIPRRKKKSKNQQEGPSAQPQAKGQNTQPQAKGQNTQPQAKGQNTQP
eukprot:CAMPEP_0177663396 /NCGR_PEP_ID=MMETSP0447-20121125/19889_1 /TAXON_ID=0 /ORGANISM="Stygamoeba regulata, Strain BSH-02190019" /LENGTH=132 /DNA_ID=CAMNT_0019169201 /DNA_START=106 /DNA_END=501 /DNA_ORIENTATION=-